MSWREHGERSTHRVGVFVAWKCSWCGKLAMTIGDAKPTKCCCASAPRVAPQRTGPDPRRGS